MDYFLSHKMQLKVHNKSRTEMCDIKCCRNDTKSQSSNPDQASGNATSSTLTYGLLLMAMFLEIQGEEWEIKHL